MDRIGFNDKIDRINFFNNVKTDSQLSWASLSKRLGTNRSMLDNYRRGNLLIPEDRFNLLLNLIKEDNQKNFLKKYSRKKENWGQIKGGKSAYRINQKKFELGRKRGGFSVKYEFDVNQSLSEELCEFIGVVIGDGFTNKYGTLYQMQIAGDKELDKEYYINNLDKICVKLFNISPKITINDNGIRLNIYSKRLFEMLTKRFGIPAGVKSYTVKIPDEIISSEKKMIKSVLRGMFNTDGGVGFDKRKTYKNPYIRVNYTSASPVLISQLHDILAGFSIPHSIHTKGNTEMIQINGEKNVKLFLSEIGFSNPRHLNKVAYLLS